MTTAEESKDLFANATADFPPITGAPTKDNVKLIHEVLTNFLHSINNLGGEDRILGILNNPDADRAAYGQDFDRPEVTLAAYDPTIKDGTKTTIRVKAER